jgi:hypothetical protein
VRKRPEIFGYYTELDDETWGRLMNWWNSLFEHERNELKRVCIDDGHDWRYCPDKRYAVCLQCCEYKDEPDDVHASATKQIAWIRQR